MLAILVSYRKFIAVCVALALGMAVTYLAITKKTYTATVSILVDARGRGPVGSEQSANLNISPDATLVESQVKLLSSDTVLRRVVIRENLGADPEYVPTQPGLRASIMALIGLSSPAPEGEDRITRALAAFSRTVAVKRSERTYVIDVEVSSLDPKKAARLANDIADAYIADQQDAKSDVVRRDSVWLKQRVADLAERVREADNKVQQFKQNNRITDANGKLVNEQELSELTTELARARSRTSEAKSKYEQIQKIVATGRVPEAITDAIKSTMLDRLRAQYAEIVRQEANYRTTLGDRHPALREVQTQLRDTRQLIIEEARRIAEAASNEYAVARASQADMGRRIEEARKTTNSTNHSIVELKELERDAEATRVVFERFLRARESISADVTEGASARVIAPASPPQAPSAPKSMAILAIALATGLFVGSGGALVHEYLNASAPAGAGTGASRRPPAAPAWPSGLKVIGSIPRVRAAADKRDPVTRLRDLINRRKPAAAEAASLSDMYLRDPKSPFSLSIDTLCKAVAPSAGAKTHGEARTILVAGASAGCGSTSIAVNLARAAAARGAVVLLIDANRAHPALGELVGDAQPGLIDLPGETRVIYPVENGPRGELHVVPIMESESSIVKRLSRRSTTARFEGISDNFDVVVIDGPSLEDADDAKMVADAVDHVVIVAANDPAKASEIEELLADLDISKRKFAGAILSDAPARAA